jgi:phosphotransferase system IIB component
MVATFTLPIFCDFGNFQAIFGNKKVANSQTQKLIHRNVIIMNVNIYKLQNPFYSIARTGNKMSQKVATIFFACDFYIAYFCDFGNFQAIFGNKKVAIFQLQILNV